MKTCPQCKITYEDLAKWFSKDKKRRSGFCCWCKPCCANAGAKDYLKHREKRLRNNKAGTKELKLEVLNAYGGSICVCCGEKEVVFLCIDHIGGGGSQHRLSIGHKGKNFWRWLKNNKFPPGYQVLCHNCNMAIRWGKTCPHQIKE